MPASAALLGYGSVFEIVNENSPNQYTALAEVFNITPPSSTIDMIDVTHMQSPNRTREFISGLIDPGEMSFEMNFVPGSASDDRLHEILELPVGVSRRRSCRVSFPNGHTRTFDGELMTYEPAVPTDDKMTATVTFKVTGLQMRGST